MDVVLRMHPQALLYYRKLMMNTDTVSPASTKTLIPTSSPYTPPTVDVKPQPYQSVRFNALKHGILSRYTVLSHENHADYESLVNSLMDEHLPAGATEQHLIEELASIIWRKRRVLQAEGATINQDLKAVASNTKAVVQAATPFQRGVYSPTIDFVDMMDRSPDDVSEYQHEAAQDLESIRKASRLLRQGAKGAYAKAISALLPDLQEMWLKAVEAQKYAGNEEGLRLYIGEVLDPLIFQIDKEARYHEDIKNQALGQGLVAYKLQQLSRYETHLDRKFERTLGMLIKLKEMRIARESQNIHTAPGAREKSVSQKSG